MKLISLIKSLKAKPQDKLFIKEVFDFKHFPSSVREWNNSIFVYNKNALRIIPNTTKSAIKLIKSYFYLYNKGLEKKLRANNFFNRFRKLSSNRIYISNGEFKHTNNKVIITLYLFNRQKNNFLLTLKKWYIKKYLKKIFGLKKNFLMKKFVNKNEKLSFKIILLKRLEVINIKGLKALKKANEDKHNVLKVLNELNNKKTNKIQNYKAISDYVNNFYRKLLKKSLKKIEIYIYYKQLIYINNSKLNYTYLQYLKNYLQVLYNKNVEFNFVNLKKFYLNSNILSESIMLKITKNRKKLLKFLNILANKVKIQKKKYFLGEKIKGINLEGILEDYFSEDEFISGDISDFSEEKGLINNLKYRHITGFRLEAKGRLTKRYTASKSMSKLRYKGNLLDIDSSYRGLSTLLLNGNIKSNVQYTKLNSKSRIGSFGIKGWVSGN